jgi:hypothetical protein
MKSLLRITTGVLVAVPSVAVLTMALFALPPSIAAGVGIAGMASLTSTKYVHNKWLAAVGGLFAFSGVVAYALRA